ncbi:MAG: carbohydrate kinase family protein [bacterium]
MKTYDCVCIGLCAADYLCLVERYPRADEKTVAVEFSKQGGGPAATAAAALGKWGAKVAFVGKVGDDEDGRFVIAELEKMNVDVTSVIVSKKSRTPKAFVWVERGAGRRTVVLDRTGMQPVRASEISKVRFPAAGFLLMDGRDTDACLRAAKITHDNGGQVILDAGSPRKKMDALFRATDYFAASHTFIRHYFGRMSTKTACHRILESGPRVVVITLGEKGCIIATRDEFLHIPAFRKKDFIVDTTGAGDVFHGGFVYGLIRGWELEFCARFANAAAFLKCGKLGGRAGIPTLRDIYKLI